MKRDCLKCKNPFESVGNHNRICNHCRNENLVAGAAAEDIGGMNRLENFHAQEGLNKAGTERFRRSPRPGKPGP